MTTTEFQSNIRATFDKGLALIAKKNADYASSDNPFKNFESALVVGVGVERAILLRTLDKLSRIGNLIDKEASVVDESVEDTLLDAINYLAILKCYRERNSIGKKILAAVNVQARPHEVGCTCTLCVHRY